MYHPASKLNSRKKVKYTIFVKVKQSVNIAALTRFLRDDMISTDTWVTPKFMANEEIRRIGFLGGINLHHSCIKWYTNLLYQCTGMVNEEIEIKKKKTYEKGYNT